MLRHVMYQFSRAGRSSRGSSVIELLTVVGLMGIVSAIAYSSLQPYTHRYRLKAATTVIAGEMGRARQDAIRTRLCHFYLPFGSSRFQIVRDDQANQNCQLDATDPVLRDINLQTQFPTVMFSTGGATADPYGAVVVGPNPTNIRFEPRGLVTGAGGATVFLTSLGYGPYAVTVTAAGSVRSWRFGSGSWQ